MFSNEQTFKLNENLGDIYFPPGWSEVVWYWCGRGSDHERLHALRARMIPPN